MNPEEAIRYLQQLPQLQDHNNLSDILTINEKNNRLEAICIDFNCDLKNIPDFIFKIKTLKQLTIKNNQLVEIPDGIEHLIHLKTLDFSKNAIKKISPQISNLDQLRKLNLEGNKLEFLPDQMATMNNLEWLNLSENLLTGIPNCIQNLKNLKHLELVKNNLFNPNVKLFTKINSLVYLKLSKNYFEDKNFNKLLELRNKATIQIDVQYPPKLFKVIILGATAALRTKFFEAVTNSIQSEASIGITNHMLNQIYSFQTSSHSSDIYEIFWQIWYAINPREEFDEYGYYRKGTVYRGTNRLVLLIDMSVKDIEVIPRKYLDRIFEDFNEMVPIMFVGLGDCTSSNKIRFKELIDALNNDYSFNEQEYHLMDPKEIDQDIFLKFLRKEINSLLKRSH